MCGTPTYTQTKQTDPAWELALLLGAEFRGYPITTPDVRRLIRTKWDQLTKLAHAIHAEEIAKKDSELRKAVRNILALSEDGVMAVVEGKAYMAPARRDDFLIVAEAIKRASE